MDRLSVPAPNETCDVDLGDGERILLRRYAAAGRPAVAACHGNGFATDAYAPFWAPLIGRFDLFIFDMRHHGRNAPQEATRTGIDRYCRDHEAVYAAVRAAAPGVPLISAFHSLSAITALFQAVQGEAEPPDRLILFDPPMQPPQGHPLHDYARNFEMMLADWSATRPERFAVPADLAAQFGKSRSLSGWIDGAHDLMARSILREDEEGVVLCCPPAVESQNYIDNANLISWDLVTGITTPITLIAGDPDHPAKQSPPKVCAAMAEDRPIDYHRIGGTTHLLQIEKPEECRAAFLEAVGDV